MKLHIAIYNGLWVLSDPYHAENFTSLDEVDSYLEMMHASILGDIRCS